MAQSRYLQVEKPTPGADLNVWGGKLNDVIDILDDTAVAKGPAYQRPNAGNDRLEAGDLWLITDAEPPELTVYDGTLWHAPFGGSGGDALTAEGGAMEGPFTWATGSNTFVVREDVTFPGSDEDAFVLVAPADTQLVGVVGQFYGQRGTSGWSSSGLAQVAARSNNATPPKISGSVFHQHGGDPDRDPSPQCRLVTVTYNSTEWLAFHFDRNGHAHQMYNGGVAFTGLLENATMQAVGESAAALDAATASPVTNTGALEYNGETLATENYVDNEIDQIPTDGGGGGGTGTGEVVTYHIDDFGADPTGATASDAALDDMVAAASPHDRLLLTEGRYRFDNTHWFTEPYKIVGTNGEIDARFGTEDYYFNQGVTVEGQVQFQFRGSRISGGGSFLQENVSRGENVIVVDDSTQFFAEDEVVIVNTGFLSRSYQPTRTRILEVRPISGGFELHLEGAARHDYATIDSAAIYRLDAPVGGVFKDLNFVAPDGTYPGGWTEEELPNIPLGCYNSADTQFINCRVDGYNHHAYAPIDGRETYFEDCDAFRPRTCYASRGEAFYLVGGTDYTLVRPKIYVTRRGIDCRAGTDNVHVWEPEMREVVNHGFSWHNGDDGTSSIYGSRTIHGGFIQGPRANPPVEYTGGFGNGANSSVNAYYDKFIGTTFQGKNRSVHAYGNNQHFINCTFEPLISATLPIEVATPYGYTGNGVKFSNCLIKDSGISTGPLVDVTGSTGVVNKNVTFDECTFKASSSSHIFNVTGVNGLRVSGNVDVTGADRVYAFDGDVKDVKSNLTTEGDAVMFAQINGGEDYKFRGDADGLFTSAVFQLAFDPRHVDIDMNVRNAGNGRMVRIYEAEDVTVSGDFDGQRDGVALTRTPIRNVNVDGLTVRAGTTYGPLGTQGATTGQVWEDIRVKNCWSHGAVDTTGGSDVLGLWVRDNTLGAVNTKVGDTVMNDTATDNRIV